jgi:uncharacterized protein with PIN domain
MSAALEAELWCPKCKDYLGKLFRQEVREGMYTHYTEPGKMPKYCTKCKSVIVRKA